MRKSLLILLCTFHFSLFTFSQGVWTQRASFPGPARGWATRFSIGNVGYIGMGTNTSTWFHDLWQYNPANNTWIQKASFPGKATEYPVTFVIGHKAYLVCGMDSSLNTFYRECWVYDATTDIWKQKSNFPGAARTWAFGFSIGKKGFIGAGDRNGIDFYKDFWEYDTTNDLWTRKTDFGGIARGGALGFAVNGKGYVFFGVDSTAFPYRDMWVYDTTTDTWTQKASCPDVKNYYGFSGASGFVIGTNIYAGVGQAYDTSNFQYDYTKTFWKYNTVTDSWNQEASFIGNGRVMCSSFSIADSGYLGLGIDSTISFVYNTWYKFYPDTLTGINQVLQNDKNVSIYPNPFHSYTEIILNNSEEVVNISCYDLLERKHDIVYNLGRKNQNSVIRLFRNSLPDGVYIIHVQTQGDSFTCKLITN